VPLAGCEAPSGAVVVTAPSGRDLALRPVVAEDSVLLLDTADALPSVRGTALLARCLSEGEAAARSLTVGDREALLLQLRRITIGERIECLVRCPADACREEMEASVNIGRILIDRYEDVRSQYEIAVAEPPGSYRVRFRLPTADDLDQGARLARADANAGALAILRRCVLEAEHDHHLVDTDALPPEIRSFIAAAMAERDPQAEVELELRCPACGREFSALLDATTFLLRELEERAVRLIRDVHALALRYGWSEAEILRMPASRRARYIELLSDARVIGA